jgi:hypothetical protein
MGGQQTIKAISNGLTKTFLSSLLIAACCALACCPVSEAQAGLPDSGASESVDALSNAILKNEIELFRLTTLFRLNNRRETAIHKWFETISGTAAYGVVTAGNITTFSNAFRYHHTPERLSVGRAESGPFLILLAELMFVGRTIGSTMLDLEHAWRVHNRGFDQVIFDRKANQLQSEIRTLLARRRQLTGGDAEQAVLQDIADGATLEFANNYARATRLRAFRQLRNLMFNYTSGSGAFWGALLTYRAAVRRNPRLVGPAGVGFIVSGTGLLTSDAISYFGGKLAEKRAKARLHTKVEVAIENARLLEGDQQSLKAQGGSTQSRLKAYDNLYRCLTSERALTEQENKEMWHRYLHDQFINGVEGGANISAGSILAYAGYNFPRTQLDPLAERHALDQFLERFGWAALVFTPSGTGGIVDTPGEALYGVYRHNQNVKQSLAPEVVLNDRLRLLNEIDKSI